MKRFSLLCVCLNLATIVLYGTIGHAEGELFNEETTTLAARTVSKAECEKGDCNLAVYSTGSGSELNDGCTKTGDTCTGTCSRCQGSSPAQATGYCKKKDTTKTCYVEETISGADRGKFSCGDSHKYQCDSNDGEGPSTCCTKTQPAVPCASQRHHLGGTF